MDEQAKDRAHRIGQKSEVRVYRLITRSLVEEGMHSRAIEKKDMESMIIGAGLFNQNATD
jgi:SNF2 family DNA or RNA helicase